MGFLDRLSNGWRISLNSFKVLKANKQLLIFPVLSGISIILVMGSFITFLLAAAGWDIDTMEEPGRAGSYAILLGFYVVNYFIITFFNMALIHCTRLYFRGEEVTVKAGLKFSMSRIGAIFSWALLAGTVGAILKIIQENSGTLGKILTGLLGIVWSVATFFVVPVIAYENLGPFGAFKRSSQIMREKWGESLASRFSFGLIQFLAILVVGLIFFLAGSMVHVILGMVMAVLGAFIVITVMSAVQTIFVSAVYHNVTGDPVELYNQQLIDGLFQGK
ncbi:MAG TPA: DUF6159 family protein [Flavisolibacter sp.]|nr:DUF6159 family protein [Flavisolibacter sp.]